MVYIIVSLSIICADFITKLVILNNAEVSETLFSIPGIFDITYVQNRGAAFSMLSGRITFLSLLSAAFCIGVIVYAVKFKPSETLIKTALSLMFAGAFGNGIDRIFYGFVVDFIRVKFIDFPVFNIADIAVTSGAVLFVIYAVVFDKKPKNNGGDTE